MFALKVRSVGLESAKLRFKELVLLLLLILLRLRVGELLDGLQELVLFVNKHALQLFIFVFDCGGVPDNLLNLVFVLLPESIKVFLETTLDYFALFINDLLNGNFFVPRSARKVLVGAPVHHLVSEQHLNLLLRLLESIFDARVLG